MIKITSFSGGYCKVSFEVEPTRPANIREPKLGVALAQQSPDYSYTDGTIYRVVDQVNTDDSIGGLWKRQEDAQEEFSRRIHRLKQKVDEFKLLQELTKKEKEKKNENKTTD